MCKHGGIDPIGTGKEDILMDVTSLNNKLSIAHGANKHPTVNAGYYDRQKRIVLIQLLQHYAHNHTHTVTPHKNTHAQAHVTNTHTHTHTHHTKTHTHTLTSHARTPAYAHTQCSEYEIENYVYYHYYLNINDKAKVVRMYLQGFFTRQEKIILCV